MNILLLDDIPKFISLKAAIQNLEAIRLLNLELLPWKIPGGETLIKIYLEVYLTVEVLRAILY